MYSLAAIITDMNWEKDQHVLCSSTAINIDMNGRVCGALVQFSGININISECESVIHRQSLELSCILYRTKIIFIVQFLELLLIVPFLYSPVNTPVLVHMYMEHNGDGQYKDFAKSLCTLYVVHVHCVYVAASSNA